jgi:hypothetical protein
MRPALLFLLVIGAPPAVAALLDGGHTDGPNWPVFLKWADRYISVAKTQPAPPKLFFRLKI